MNSPTIETERFLLRRAQEADLPGLFEIYSDPEVMRYVPIFPIQDMAGMRQMFEKEWLPCYQAGLGYQYAVCLKATGEIVGYANINMTNSAYDLGYGVRRAWWHRGVASESAKALADQARADGLPYITATHIVENPHSGGVMRKIGMTYRYSYHEQWMPKNISVVFRMYQLDLNGSHPAYTAYQRLWPWFIEKGLG